MTSSSNTIFFVLITGVLRTFVKLVTKLVILPTFLALDTWAFLEATVTDLKGAYVSDGEVTLAPLGWRGCIQVLLCNGQNPSHIRHGMLACLHSPLDNFDWQPLCKCQLHLFSLSMGPVPSSVLPPPVALRYSYELWHSPESLYLLQAKHWWAYTQVQNVWTKSWQHLHCTEPFGAMNVSPRNTQAALFIHRWDPRHVPNQCHR